MEFPKQICGGGERTHRDEVVNGLASKQGNKMGKLQNDQPHVQEGITFEEVSLLEGKPSWGYSSPISIRSQQAVDVAST